MITFSGTSRFSGHEPSHLDTKRASVFQNSLPRSTGPVGSIVSMNSMASKRSNASAKPNVEAKKVEGKTVETKKREPQPVLSKLSNFAYQQAILSTHAYWMATMGLAHFMASSAWQGKHLQQDLLTQIRSTEIDKQGADIILNNLNATTEAFDALQKNLDQLVQNHHKIVEAVRQDPRFDRRA